MRDTKNGSNPQNHLDYFHFFMSYQLISMRELPASVTIQTTADFFHSWHGQISWHHRGIEKTFQAFFAEKIFQPTEVVLNNQEVKEFGDTAVVISDVDYGLLLDGKPTTHHFATTEVFHKQDGQWKLIQVTFTALVY